MVHWDGTSRNGSLGWYKQKWFIRVVQVEMVHWDGTSRNGSLRLYKQKWFIVMLQVEMSHVIRLWNFSSSVKSFFKRACAAQPSSGARCLIFGWTIHFLLHFMCANSVSSAETAWMCRLV